MANKKCPVDGGDVDENQKVYMFEIWTVNCL